MLDLDNLKQIKNASAKEITSNLKVIKTYLKEAGELRGPMNWRWKLVVCLAKDICVVRQNGQGIESLLRAGWEAWSYRDSARSKAFILCFWHFKTFYKDVLFAPLCKLPDWNT